MRGNPHKSTRRNALERDPQARGLASLGRPNASHRSASILFMHRTPVPSLALETAFNRHRAPFAATQPFELSSRYLDGRYPQRNATSSQVQDREPFLIPPQTHEQDYLHELHVRHEVSRASEARGLPGTEAFLLSVLGQLCDWEVLHIGPALGFWCKSPPRTTSLGGSSAGGCIHICS